MITSAIIDTREPDWVQALTFGNVPTTSLALDSGDVLCATDDACQILIERKTPTDLLNTLRHKRFLPQIEQMIKVTPWSYIVITGILYRDRDNHITVSGQGHTGWNFDSVQGALLTAQEMGVGVLTCGSDEDFEQCVIRLCNRDRDTVRIRPPREVYLLRDGEAALAALPGIGVERIQTLIQVRKTPAAALEWLTDIDNRQKIDGIAEGTKLAVRKALGLEGEKVFVVPQDVASFYTPEGRFVIAEQETYDWLCNLENGGNDGK